MKFVTFVKNPVGMYNLSYEIGETVSLPDSLASDLIEDKIAVDAADPSAADIPAPKESFRLGDEEKVESKIEEVNIPDSLASAPKSKKK